jgi:septal ring-binding cell division protein DamX
MKPEPIATRLLLIALLACAGNAIAEDFKPGVQHICIPNAARDGWDCGTVDNPPKPAVAEEEVVEEEAPAPTPPPFLANPDRPRTAPVKMVRSPPPAPMPEPELPTIEESTPVEASPIVEAAPEPSEPVSAPIQTPTAAETTPLESAPLEEPVVAEARSLPEPSAPVTPELEVAEPAIEPVAMPEDEPVVEETVVAPTAEIVTEPVPQVEPTLIPEPTPVPLVTEASAVPETAAPAVVEAMPDPEPEPVTAPKPTPAPVSAPVTPAVAPGKLYLSSLQGARAFALLPPSHFTLQLAHAASAEGFPTLIQQLGIDYRQCYVLRVRRDGGDWWVLAYGSFVDVNAAKSALMRVRPAPGMTAVWPRRVGCLQGEYQH